MRLRASHATTACAAAALAMVFSVQQGKHGPLVVYKLEVPQPPAAAARSLPSPAAPEPVYVIPSRAPAVLGTVVIPSDSAPVLPVTTPPATTLPVAAAPAKTPESIPLQTEGIVTLQEVSDEVMWRRETVERLPQAPFAPRF